MVNEDFENSYDIRGDLKEKRISNRIATIKEYISDLKSENRALRDLYTKLSNKVHEEERETNEKINNNAYCSTCWKDWNLKIKVKEVKNESNISVFHCDICQDYWYSKERNISINDMK